MKVLKRRTSSKAKCVKCIVCGKEIDYMENIEKLADFYHVIPDAWACSKHIDELLSVLGLWYNYVTHSMAVISVRVKRRLDRVRESMFKTVFHRVQEIVSRYRNVVVWAEDGKGYGIVAVIMYPDILFGSIHASRLHPPVSRVKRTKYIAANILDTLASIEARTRFKGYIQGVLLDDAAGAIEKIADVAGDDDDLIKALRKIDLREHGRLIDYDVYAVVDAKKFADEEIAKLEALGLPSPIRRIRVSELWRLREKISKAIESSTF